MIAKTNLSVRDFKNLVRIGTLGAQYPVLMVTDETDWGLVKRYAETRDAEAFSLLVERHVQFVYRTARRRAAHHADDVTQAVFLLLSQRAGSLQKKGSLIGWLYGATRLCAMNVIRMEQRRLEREREASMSKEIREDRKSDEAIGHLDAGLLSLRAQERDAVMLRYLEHKSFIETGRALGISEEAARKRSERGLDKLRQFFSRRGYAMTAGAIAAALLEESSRAAPPALSHALIASAGSASALGTTKAAILAQGVARTLAASSWKAAASIAAALALTGTVGLAIHHFAAPVQAATSTALTTLAPGLAADDTVPQRVCFAGMEMVLDAKGAEALRKAAGEMASDSTFFEIRQGKSADIRAALQKIQSEGQIVCLGNPWELATRPNISNGQLGLMNGSGPASTFNQNNHTFGISIIKNEGPGGDPFKGQAEGSNARIDFDGASMQAILQSGPPVSSTRPRLNNPLNPNAPGVERLVKEGSLHWSGTVSPGQMAIMIADFGDWGGGHFVCVRFFEVYSATGIESRYLQGIDGKQWIKSGQEEALTSADRAIVWAGMGQGPFIGPADKNPWVKRLSDGTTVELVDVSRPREMPLARWTPDGQPLAPLPSNIIHIPLQRTIGAGRENAPGRGQGNPPDPLSLTFRMYRPKSATGARSLDDGFFEVATVVPDDAGRARLFVGAGDWKVQPIPEAGSVNLGEDQVSLRNAAPQNNGQGLRLAAIESTPDPKTEVRLGVETRDHRQIIADDTQGPWSAARQLGNQSGGVVQVRQDEVDHYVVFSRPREEIVFEGYKDRPAIDMPVEVTQAQARAAEKRIVEWEWKTQWAYLSASLARLDSIPRDPATPDGTIRIMMDKANAGDETALRTFFEGEPEKSAALSASVISYVRAQNAAIKKFGLESMCRAFLEQHPYIAQYDGFGKLAPEGWVITGDRAHNDSVGDLLTKQNGVWRFRISDDAIPDTFNRFQAADEAFLKDLEDGNIATPAEAIRRLKFRYPAAPTRVN